MKPRSRAELVAAGLIQEQPEEPKPLETVSPEQINFPWLTTDEFLEVWPENILFMLKVSEPKKGKCTYCGENRLTVKYSGRMVKWNLCNPHAQATADWAKDNVVAMDRHAEIAESHAKFMKRKRAAERMAEVLRGKA